MNDKNFGAMMASIGLALLAVVMLMLGRGGEDNERLELPAASEVTACYYIPDVAAPYEQTWLGGEKLEAVLAELAETEFTEAEEAPDEGSFRASLVIATNEEQITVHADEDGRAWVFYEGRWLHET
jgi:hypothetical protein